MGFFSTPAVGIDPPVRIFTHMETVHSGAFFSVSHKREFLLNLDIREFLLLFFLHLFQKRTSGDRWNRSLRSGVILPVTQPTVSKY